MRRVDLHQFSEESATRGRAVPATTRARAQRSRGKAALSRAAATGVTESGAGIADDAESFVYFILFVSFYILLLHFIFI